MTVYNDGISRYIGELFVQEDAALRQIYQDTPAQGLPAISIKPEEGRFLEFLVHACSAKKVVEIGTLGGYSGTWIARGLPPGGRLITLELDPHHAEVARRHFTEAGVADRIDLRLGNAHHTLQSLSVEGPFDFVFIDAEKQGYPAYLDWALANVRPGGVIAAHNAFRKGSVAGQGQSDEFTEVTRLFNQRIASQAGLISTIFPAGDGMVIAVKTG